MIKMKWFSIPVPTQFDGYNEGTGMLFPYWSSPAITRVMMITALSKYQHVAKKNFERQKQDHSDHFND